MNSHLLLARADAHLDAEWRESRTPWGRKPAGSFVTLSREAGSGGASLARLLAKQLNAETSDSEPWRIFEDNLTTKMLKDHQLATRIARFLPEDRTSEIHASIGEMVGLHPCLWELVQKMNETMRQLATNGHAILVGRGANFATAGITRGLHVRLVAPVDHRAAYLTRLYNISTREALAHNARRDAGRRRYVATHFNADVADPAAYDLTINTARVPLPEAAKLIATHVRARQPAAA